MTTWLGIRYARARRFSPPELVPDLHVAGAFGPSAPQPRGGQYANPVPGMDVGETDEDCLFLNVWAPDHSRDAPVMVWVHGGAFVTGGAVAATFDGARLSGHGVVVVTLNYRLGALGFLGGNWALLDIVAALEWVREHIERFGGSPECVTLFGESAGATAVLHTLTVPRAVDLLHRAIVQSPGALVHTAEMADLVQRRFRELLGRDPTSASVDELLRAQIALDTDLAGAAGPMPWHPFVDGTLIETTPRAALLAGAGHNVPVMIGMTTEELRLFARNSYDRMTRAELLDSMAASLSSALLVDVGRPEFDRFVAGYSGLTGRDLFSAVLTDLQVGAPMLRVADALAARGPTYVYSFDWRAPVVGAAHQIELPFVFGTLERDGWSEYLAVDDDALRLAQDTMATWTAFATRGDPAVEQVGPWPLYSPKARVARILGRSHALALAPSAPALGVLLGRKPPPA